MFWSAVCSLLRAEGFSCHKVTKLYKTRYSWIFCLLMQCCGSWMVIPDLGSGFASMNLSIFSPKTFSKLSDLDSFSSWIRDPGVKKSAGSRIRIGNTDWLKNPDTCNQLRIRIQEVQKLTGPTDPEHGGKPDITVCWRQAACRRGEETRPPSSRGVDPPAPSQYRPPCERPGSGARTDSPPARTAARQECQTPSPCCSKSFIIWIRQPLEGCNAALATRTPMRGTKLVSCHAANAYFEYRYRLCTLVVGCMYSTWYRLEIANVILGAISEHARATQYHYLAYLPNTLATSKLYFTPNLTNLPKRMGSNSGSDSFPQWL